MTEVEQEHIIAALSFELGKCDDPVVHKNTLAQINKVRPLLLMSCRCMRAPR